MRKYEIVTDNIIISIGEAERGGETITEERYEAVKTALSNRPEETEEIGYRLKSDLTWEQYEKEPEPEPEPTADEALAILLGEE